MHPDDDVCLCFRVPLCKLRSFLHRERPRVASQLSECLGAGTGCGWCVPYLEHLHKQHTAGDPSPGLTVSAKGYAQSRLAFRQTGERPG